MNGRTDGQRGPIEALGRRLAGGIAYVGGMALLTWRVLCRLRESLFSSRWRSGWAALTFQMVRVGVRSATIVSLVQVFIGVILTLQMAPPLEPWGQLDKIAMIIGVAGFRMLGPIITGVVLSGFAGASIAAELGAMVATEEVEALEAQAINPIRFLVVPRVLATVITMVALTAVADWMIALGGYVTTRVALGPAVYTGYWDRMREQLQARDFFSGLIMAAVFGLLISVIACYEGLGVRRDAESVGRATTMTVVYSIVGIIAAACVFTMIFYVLEF